MIFVVGRLHDIVVSVEDNSDQEDGQPVNEGSAEDDSREQQDTPLAIYRVIQELKIQYPYLFKVFDGYFATVYQFNVLILFLASIYTG